MHAYQNVGEGALGSVKRAPNSIKAPVACRELGGEKVRCHHRGYHGRSLSWPFLLVLGFHHLHSGPSRSENDRYRPDTSAGRRLRWGAQIDARRLLSEGASRDDDAVAAYVAKYVTKGATDTGAGTDYPIAAADDIESVPVNDHVRRLMRTCWRLGGLSEYEPLRLRAWAHTLGYRGHILTNSRAYSTTYAVLRAERARHAGHVDMPDEITERHWRYVGSGHTPGAALIAAGVADDLAEPRCLAAEGQREGRWR